MARQAIPKPSKELLNSCRILKIRHEKGFIFTYRGHEVDLSDCDGRFVSVLNSIAVQLADKLTSAYNDAVGTFFGI